MGWREKKMKRDTTGCFYFLVGINILYAFYKLLEWIFS